MTTTQNLTAKKCHGHDIDHASAVEPVCSCPRPMPASDGECQRCFGQIV